MENSPRLYSELVGLCGQPGQWRDVRHVQTLAWMVVGLVQAECVKLTAWVPFVQGRAQYAQSTQRRFRRWLGNRRIEVAPLYGPLIAQALQDWGTHPLYLALDTSMLWNQYCLLRLSVVYRGRAVPIMWEVIEHGSSSVTHDAYAALLDAVPALLPVGVKVVFLADRGFADTDLSCDHQMIKQLHWPNLSSGSRKFCCVHFVRCRHSAKAVVDFICARRTTSILRGPRRDVLQR